MSRDLQIRSPLQNSIQQHNNRAAGSLIAKQIQSFTYEGTARSLDPEKDTAIVDTTGGTVTMLLPVGSDANKGLPFFFYKLVAGNTLTVARATGSGQTIEGATSVSATGIGACIAMFWDGSTWRRVNASVAAATGLLAANNLSDLANATTARTNLAVNKVYVPLRVSTLVGSGVYRVISKYAGTVTLVDSIIEGVLTTADATLQAKLNGSNIGSTTTGLITITQAGSAAGDKDSASPLTTNITVAVGDELSLTVGGTNATATAANCWFEITRTA